MHKATMFEAKTNLSQLVKRALNGEDVQITTGRERKPVVRIVAIEPVNPNRRLGFMEGQGRVGAEFFAPLPEDELRKWNGEDE